MKILRILLSLLVLTSCSTGLFAQARVSAWQIHEGNEGNGNGIIAFNTSATSDANSRRAAFEKGIIPPQKDTGWKPAKTNSDGTVNFSQRSRISDCGNQLDFTYFQATVFVPKNIDLKTLTVSYDRADDGARIYFFNSKHPTGHFNENSDLVGGSAKPFDLKDEVIKGKKIVLSLSNTITARFRTMYKAYG